jgi:voltage-gated potassium channel
MTESETTSRGRTSTDGNMGYEIFMAGLSILSIVNLALALFVQDEALSYVIVLINLLLTLIFMLDFLWRLFRAESKRQYLVGS